MQPHENGPTPDPAMLSSSPSKYHLMYDLPWPSGESSQTTQTQESPQMVQLPDSPMSGKLDTTHSGENPGELTSFHDLEQFLGEQHEFPGDIGLDHTEMGDLNFLSGSWDRQGL